MNIELQNNMQFFVVWEHFVNAWNSRAYKENYACQNSYTMVKKKCMVNLIWTQRIQYKSNVNLIKTIAIQK